MQWGLGYSCSPNHSLPLEMESGQDMVGAEARPGLSSRILGNMRPSQEGKGKCSENALMSEADGGLLSRVEMELGVFSQGRDGLHFG